jgi:hypothetical protein
VGRPDFKFVVGLDIQQSLVSFCIDFQRLATHLRVGWYRPVTGNSLAFGSNLGSKPSNAGA